MAAPQKRDHVLPDTLKRLATPPPGPEIVCTSHGDGTDAAHIGVLDDGTAGVRVYNDDATDSVTLDYDTIRALIALLP